MMIKDNYIASNDVNVTCKEYSAPDVLDTFGTQNNQFSVFHVNCRKLKAHFDEVSNLLGQMNFCFPIIGLSETWLSDDLKDQYSIQGYSSEYTCRQHSSYGGVALYLKEQLTYNIRKDLASNIDCCETLWVEIPKESFHSQQLKKNLIIAVMYRSPSSPLPDYLDYLETCLHQITSEKKLAVLMGDLNIDLLSDSSSVYSNCMESCGFRKWITLPTRQNDQSSTLIDHIYSNMDLLNINSGILINDLSDHFPIFAFTPNNINLKNRHYREKIITR